MSLAESSYKIVSRSCRTLLLPNTAVAVAMTFLHRYCSLAAAGTTQEDTVVLHTAVVYLASKTTENLRMIRDIYNMVYKSVDASISLDALDSEYVKSKEAIIAKEHEVLRFLRFDVDVDLPHKYLLNIARYLHLDQDVVHIAWRHLNDAFMSSRTADRHIINHPQILASACILLAIEVYLCEDEAASSGSKDSRRSSASAQFVRLPPCWWRGFDVEDDDLVDASTWICETCVDHMS
mmetsp:Transcript_17013/g.37832  ORF Transcript_17013/g.37832 Transcript_17013/m.37832 type:complete len:236 (+) Transcript_17013:82-789(+)